MLSYVDLSYHLGSKAYVIL